MADLKNHLMQDTWKGFDATGKFVMCEICDSPADCWNGECPCSLSGELRDPTTGAWIDLRNVLTQKQETETVDGFFGLKAEISARQLKKTRMTLIDWMERGASSGYPTLNKHLVDAFGRDWDSDTSEPCPTTNIRDAIKFIPPGKRGKWFSMSQALQGCSASVRLYDGWDYIEACAGGKTLELALCSAAAKSHMYLLYGNKQPYM